MLDEPKVVVLDDEAAIADELAYWLAIKGIPCRATTDPWRALDIIEKHETVRLVLLDRRMPLMDGYEFIRRARRMANARRYVKFIMITGHLTAADFADAAANGVCALAAKPVDTRRLETLVREGLWAP